MWAQRMRGVAQGACVFACVCLTATRCVAIVYDCPPPDSLPAAASAHVDASQRQQKPHLTNSTLTLTELLSGLCGAPVFLLQVLGLTNVSRWDKAQELRKCIRKDQAVAGGWLRWW